MSEEKIVVAVAYDTQTGEVYGHFGHCPFFALYTYGEYVDDCEKTLVDTSTLSGHEQMCEKMKELGADFVIAGNMGAPAQTALLDAGIVPVIGPQGNADWIADLLVTGQLTGGGCACGGSCGGGCGDGCSDGACGCGDECGCGAN